MSHIHQKYSNLIVLQKGSVKVALLLLLLALLTSCQVKVSDWRWLTDRGVYESTERGGLRLTMSSPRFRYEPGETVIISVVLENTTAKPVLLKSATTDYAFDVSIDGQFLLSSAYPELQVFERKLAPGEKIEITYGFVPDPATTGGIIEAEVAYMDESGSGFGLGKVMSVSYGSLP